MKSVAIEREFGSGGKEIGMKLAQKAGVLCYDTELLIKTSEQMHISLDELKNFDEKQTGSFLYNLAMFTSGDLNARKGEEVLWGINETIHRISSRESAVFIGRGSTNVLNEFESGLSVYIYSSDEKKKIDRIIIKEGVTKDDALKLMEKKNRERKNYFGACTQKKWTDRYNYAIELNTAILSTEECVDILYSMMK